MTSMRNLLSSVPLFAELSRQELEQIAGVGREVEFAQGSPIVEHGMQASDFYLILDGQALLEVPKKKPRQLGPGDSFGEISVLDGGPRTATVTAQTPVKAFRLGRDEFETVLDRHGSIGRKILVEMCARLRYAESRMRPA